MTDQQREAWFKQAFAKCKGGTAIIPYTGNAALEEKRRADKTGKSKAISA